MTQRQSQKTDLNLTEKIQEIDSEFKSFLSGLSASQEPHLQTFSPLDAVQNFQFKGLEHVSEVSRAEMMASDMGMRKLLANMLAQCKPGVLSDDDVAQLSGINGREMSLD